MDQKTRDLRRRNKELAGKRGELPQFEAKGLGRKLKSAETFPIKRCDHVTGGQIIFLWRKRRDGTKYRIPWIKGGTKCSKSAIHKNKCLDHLRSAG